jgi:hypothetical protein
VEAKAMASILSFIRPAEASFPPEVTELMEGAFEIARDALGPRNQPNIVYEIIAKRIVDATGLGERDLDRLVAIALKGIR